MRRTRSLKVESEGPLHVHIDGEYMGDNRRSMSFKLLERCLPVLCKKNAPGLFLQTPRRIL
jgi:diacylglycerol kinase family enzyme